ncbi:hypothetical protein L2E82_15271 [Cichorium intybus]|uniref:Uncharacterized protein n=1 Tax=Cichorium intybus TaxID=13427 RepID=A0ACB9F2S4_CICIN|nr:hypothetical protein L2E82_15271 [Cichorium intybus]
MKVSVWVPQILELLRSERQETKVRPYFVPEHDDLQNKDHIEDDQSLEPELDFEKDQEQEELIFESHERPYFVTEHVDSVETSFLSYERQISEVSESKLSFIPDDT